MKKRLKPVFYFIWFTVFFIVYPLGAREPIDMSDLLLKVNEPSMFFNLGPRGFAVHDVGAERLKIFDWDIKPVRGIPVIKGEGPGEIKNFILSACRVDNRLYLLGFMENRLQIYNQEGSFIRALPLDFVPREMVYRRGKLYLFHLRLNATAASFPLAKVIDPKTGKVMREIVLTEKLFSSATLGGNPALLGLATLFDVGDNQHIYLLNSSANLLVEIDEGGKLVRRIKLPYPERKEVESVMEDGKPVTYISMLDHYQAMRVFDNTVYTCFLRTVKRDKKTNTSVYQTYIVKILDNGKHSRKIVDGDQTIIGAHQDHLYLFNSEEYQATAIPLKEWQ